MSLETRIAVIGVVGALTGTLVGGLVTYAVTQKQINSQKQESRRSERLDAYSKYFGDATRLWTQVFAIMEGVRGRRRSRRRRGPASPRSRRP